MNAEEIKALIAAKIDGQGNQVDIGNALPEILNEIVDAIGEGGGDSVSKITVDAKITELPPDVVASVKVGDILFAKKSGVAIVSFTSEKRVIFSTISTVGGNLTPVEYKYENGTWVLDESE